MVEEDIIDMAAALTEDEDDVDTIGAVYEISVDVTAVLGTALMPISQILKLGRGAVVELDRRVGEEIELVAEENIIAKGRVVVIEDRLGVSITKIVKRF
jgi:flagellar motor switch protein FliN/FliY